MGYLRGPRQRRRLRCPSGRGCCWGLGSLLPPLPRKASTSYQFTGEGGVVARGTASPAAFVRLRFPLLWSGFRLALWTPLVSGCHGCCSGCDHRVAAGLGGVADPRGACWRWACWRRPASTTGVPPCMGNGCSSTTGTVRLMSFWISRRYSTSHRRRNGRPLAPARPVRPMRWTALRDVRDVVVHHETDAYRCRCRAAMSVATSARIFLSLKLPSARWR